MSEDISRKTILVLVVLTVIVSALGTLTVLDSVSTSQVPSFDGAPEATQSAQGQVTLRVGESRSPELVTGRVVLELRTSN
jgi:hypothetical protein